MSSSTPRALSTYEGSRLALVHADPLLTAMSWEREGGRQGEKLGVDRDRWCITRFMPIIQGSEAFEQP